MSFLAKFCRKRSHSLPTPPFVPKTNDVKVPCSTSITLCKYALFFSFSCCLKINSVLLFWIDVAFICVNQFRWSNSTYDAKNCLPLCLAVPRHLHLLSSVGISHCLCFANGAPPGHCGKLYSKALWGYPGCYHASAQWSPLFTLHVIPAMSTKTLYKKGNRAYC